MSSTLLRAKMELILFESYLKHLFSISKKGIVDLDIIFSKSRDWIKGSALLPS